MFKIVNKAERLPEQPMLYAQSKLTVDEDDFSEKLPFALAYVEILPPGIIEDEI